MSTITQHIEVCDFDALEDDSSKGFIHDTLSLFVVKKDGLVFAYKNQCPHLGLPLEMNEDEFLDCENALIQCATHGALFSIESGLCLSGPCHGESLEPLITSIKGNKVFVEIPAE